MSRLGTLFLLPMRTNACFFTGFPTPLCFHRIASLLIPPFWRCLIERTNGLKLQVVPFGSHTSNVYPSVGCKNPLNQYLPSTTNKAYIVRLRSIAAGFFFFHFLSPLATRLEVLIKRRSQPSAACEDEQPVFQPVPVFAHPPGFVLEFSRFLQFLDYTLLRETRALDGYCKALVVGVDGAPRYAPNVFGLDNITVDPFLWLLHMFDSQHWLGVRFAQGKMRWKPFPRDIARWRKQKR